MSHKISTRSIHGWPAVTALSVVALFIAVTASLALTDRARGQAVTVTWDRPVKISNDTGQTFYPTIVTDLDGRIHIFWAQGALGANYADSIYHSFWNGQSWSEPRELFLAQEGESFNYPGVALAADGVIHLVWASSGGTYYSSVPGAQADDLRAWATPELIAAAGVVSQPRIVVDQRNQVLHVLFTQRIPGTNVSYLKSTDGGQTWSEPIPVSKLVPGDPQIPDAVRAVLDSQGRLHVAWSENYPPLFVSRHVFYTRTDDFGETWTPPVDLSDPARDDDWDAAINLAIDNQDTVQAVWTCGVNPRRCYRLSNDHGDTWSSPQPLFEGLVGLSGWDAMIGDAYGYVYWLGALRYPQAQYTSVLANQRWLNPPQAVITEQDSLTLANGHFPQMVLNHGNEIHIAFVELDKGPIWYLHGTTAQAAQPLPSTPTPAPTILPTQPPTAAPSTPTPAPAKRAPVSSTLIDPDPGLRPALYAIVPVVVVILAAVGWSLLRSRR